MGQHEGVETGRRVDYVILYVKDLAAAVAYYRDVVGFDFRFSQSGYAEFSTGATRFGLLERAALRSLLGEDGEAVRPGGEVVVLVEDVDAEADRLRGAGATVLSGPADRPWGHRTLHVLDPEGFVVEFAQEIPREHRRGDG